LLPAPPQPLYLTGPTPSDISPRQIPAANKVPRGQQIKEQKNHGGNYARVYNIISTNKDEHDNEKPGNINMSFFYNA
jgi:hypothetical protein